MRQAMELWDRLLRRHLRFLLRYPLIIPRVAKNYLDLARGRPVLRGVEFALTYRCQCRCQHCSAGKLRRAGRGRELTTREAEQIIDQCLALGALNINFTGGEALYREDLGRLIRRARPRSTVVSVATNGVLLSAQKARMLRRSGARIVTISLDSPHPRQHDRRRGFEGCFEAALRACGNARDAGLDVFFCTILMKEQIENGDIHRLIRLARERGALLTVNVPWAVGRWEGHEDLLLDEREMDQFWRIVALPGVRWEGGSNYLREGCPAGVEKIYITPYGEVMPCTGLHRSFGDARRRPLEAIWSEMRNTPPFHRINHRCLAADAGQVGACKECCAGPGGGGPEARGS